MVGRLQPVIPTQAGIQSLLAEVEWIPACAGMTGFRGACPRLDRGNDGLFYATIGDDLAEHEKNPP